MGIGTDNGYGDWFDNPKQPPKSEIRKLLGQYEGFIAAFITNGALVYDTRASLFADLGRAANSSAWVRTRVADLPYSFIRLNDAGAGTANAIVATSSIPLPGAASAALLVMNVFKANTGPVTVTVNGAVAKPLKTSSGGNLAAGYLTAGMTVAFLYDGMNFRLLSDVASAAIQAAGRSSRDRRWKFRKCGSYSQNGGGGCAILCSWFCDIGYGGLEFCLVGVGVDVGVNTREQLCRVKP